MRIAKYGQVQLQAQLYTIGRSVITRDWERLLLIFAPAAYQETLLRLVHGSAATAVKMYRSIKMDSRFDSAHIIFPARRICPYCEIGRSETSENFANENSAES